MAQFSVEYTLNERALQAAIDAEVAEHQELFEDDLRGAIREAARRVIYGNFTGEGPYDPRPVGRFKGRRARYLRGWVEQNYGSQRRYLAGARREKPQHSLDHLRSAALLDAVQQAGVKNPSLRVVAAEAKLASKDPLGSREGQGFQNLRGFLQGGIGKKLTRQAEKTRQPVRLATSMRYGMQTGKLAKAWYDLSVSSTRGLRFTLHPAMGSTTGTPEAEKLTAFLSRHPGWKGLMDHDQLVSALEDQGVITLRARGD